MCPGEQQCGTKKWDKHCVITLLHDCSICPRSSTASDHYAAYTVTEISFGCCPSCKTALYHTTTGGLIHWAPTHGIGALVERAVNLLCSIPSSLCRSIALLWGRGSSGCLGARLSQLRQCFVRGAGPGRPCTRKTEITLVLTLAGLTNPS